MNNEDEFIEEGTSEIRSTDSPEIIVPEHTSNSDPAASQLQSVSNSPSMPVSMK